MTAVEWLASQLGKHIIWEEKIIDLVEQAKKMEKQQIEISDEEIAEKAEEFELTNGIYGFKHGVKWYRERLKQTHAPHLEG